MRGSGIGGWLSALLVAVTAVGLAGCASVYNLPGNVPLGAVAADTNGVSDIPSYEDDLLLALSFSGGGTRAAAFSFGVLEELDRTRSSAVGTKTLLDRVDFVSGVSGGSVTAAYFGLKRRAALDDFRQRFLLRNAEEGLKTRISLGNIGRALGGGVNDSQFTDWLDQNLFDGARFDALADDRRPRVWINASDIYNRTPFVYGKTSFDALCSDIRSYRVAEAVAASAAVPLVFAPVVLESYPDKCDANLPAWIRKARDNPNAPPLLRAFALGISRYRDGTVKYIKLLDGGLVDNFGLSGFTIGRESSEVPYGPLTQVQAARLRRVLFLIVDAGQAPQGDWARQLEGPSGADLVNAVTGAALYASVRASYAAFEGTMENWRSALIRWRCGLAPAHLQRLRGAGSADCRDLKIHIGRISFDQLGAERAAQLAAVETRFKLPVETVDALIAAGGESLAANPTYRAFLKGM